MQCRRQRPEPFLKFGFCSDHRIPLKSFCLLFVHGSYSALHVRSTPNFPRTAKGHKADNVRVTRESQLPSFVMPFFWAQVDSTGLLAPTDPLKSKARCRRTRDITTIVQSLDAAAQLHQSPLLSWSQILPNFPKELPRPSEPRRIKLENGASSETPLRPAGLCLSMECRAACRITIGRLTWICERARGLEKTKGEG